MTGYLVHPYLKKESETCKKNRSLPIAIPMSKLLKFEGYNYFRQRLILATLSGKPVRIEKIRSDDENPGLKGIFDILAMGDVSILTFSH